MTTIAYVLASNTDDQSAFLQVRDIGEADHWFVEDASCGSISVLKRPVFLKAHKFLRKGDTFVVATVDILSSSPKAVLEALQLLQKKGVSIVFVREDFNLSSTLGRAYLAMLRSIVKLERTLLGTHGGALATKRIGLPDVTSSYPES
ncbi:recombinase family protein [Pseudomonas sp. Hz4]